MSNVPEKRGDRIAGSKLYRDFCCGCGEPIRVTEADGKQTCEDCRGHYDTKGREIKAGDLLKVPHFTAARRRTRVFMHKLVCRVDDSLTIAKDGQHLYAVDVCDIYRTGSLDKAHKCPLSVVGECEIIDGGTVQDDDLFWERKRVKFVSA